MFKKVVDAIVLLSMCCTLVACMKSADDSQADSFIVSETAWIAQNDGSYLQFLNDDEWIWYRDREVKDDNFISGTYQFYQGQAALEYITNDLKDQGVTSEEMNGLFERSDEYDISNFVCMTLLHKSIILEGVEQLQEDSPTSYFGFLLKDNTYLDIANMTTAQYYGFEMEQ